MNTDDFESRLARIPLAPPPGAWRDDILEAARAATAATGNPEARSEVPPRRRAPSPWQAWLDRLRAPMPTLAGAWALALTLYLADRRLEAAPSEARPSTPVSITSVREHRDRILALAGAEEAETPGPGGRVPESHPAPTDRPRSALPHPPSTGSIAAAPRTAWS